MMDRYNGLLKKISVEHIIPRGSSEDEDSWKARLIYSILGRIAYASLWDTDDEEAGNEHTVSVVHFKRRIEVGLDTYKTAYPETARLFPHDPQALSDEIYKLFCSAGVVYTKPYRLTAAARTSAAAGKVIFTRGQALGDSVFISGLGAYYIPQDDTDNSCDIRRSLGAERLKTMFQLSARTLEEEWGEAVRNAEWKPLQGDISNEYLRSEPPFTKGYWLNKPAAGGEISMLRRGMQGARIYYLYRIDGGVLLGSQLPDWMTENSQYRLQASGCLSKRGTLPAIKYHCDGHIVHVHFDYLLPPHEQSFFNLYSWPRSCESLPCDFNRVCAKPVFEAIRDAFEDIGFKFIEE